MRRGRKSRAGAVMPLLAVSLVGLLGFVALAVDVGLIAVARSQCQIAADCAAMAGARTLNGDGAAGYNVGPAQTNARNAAAANMIGGQAVDPANVALQIGSYTYNYSIGKFLPQIPASASDTPNLVEATVTHAGTNMFAKAFGVSAYNISSTATAVHRPRDVAVILDLSGSMRFDSLLGIPYSGDRTQSNNSDTVIPAFGHYTSSSAALRNTSSVPASINGDTYGLANFTIATDAGAPIVGDYGQNGPNSPLIDAFSPAPGSYATAPAGDRPLVRFGLSTPGRTVQAITNGATFNGYTATPFTGYTGPAVAEFQGYTQGPGHWGKTFFIWPPDPRASNDWRTKFFDLPGSSTTGINDNTRLWDSSGNWLAPGASTYDIKYNTILAWIKQAPCPFPAQLRAGRILYYDAIPSTISTASFPPSDPNQRFWKEYIDYVLGVYQTGSGTYDVITPMTGYGDDFTWSSVQITAKPSGTGIRDYMNYNDSPKRPRLHFWFGPLTMVDFLANYNLWVDYSSHEFRDPGNIHVGPLWSCKLGVQAAMMDVKDNHPNDFVSLMFFNRPKYSASSRGSFNRTRVPLGRDYQRVIDTLWFPTATIDNPGTEIRPYSSENSEVPRASNGTSPVMGFMLAYNQFSSNVSLRSYATSPAPYGEAGGLGRRGAQRLVIFETDGMANTLAAAGFTNLGAYESFYNVRHPGEYPSNSGSDVVSQIYSVVNQICAFDTANPPGYSTNRKPVLIHCLALGPIFDPSSTNSDKGPALTLLQNIQYIGATQSSPSTPLADYKIINGTGQQRMDKLRQAFGNIMQDGIQVSLIR